MAKSVGLEPNDTRSIYMRQRIVIWKFVTKRNRKKKWLTKERLTKTAYIQLHKASNRWLMSITNDENEKPMSLLSGFFSFGFSAILCVNSRPNSQDCSKYSPHVHSTHVHEHSRAMEESVVRCHYSPSNGWPYASTLNYVYLHLLLGWCFFLGVSAFSAFHSIYYERLVTFVPLFSFWRHLYLLCIYMIRIRTCAHVHWCVGFGWGAPHQWQVQP